MPLKKFIIQRLNKLPYIRTLHTQVQEQRQQIKKCRLDCDLIARHYLSGEGIEIGALHNPLPLSPVSARVKYVDRMPVAELRRQYPELKKLPLVEVDIVADGEQLETIPSASQDFVIANHFIEHCQNPVLAIENMLRVLKTGGVVFMAVPDKRHTFDKYRPVTTIDHLLKDYQKGPEWSRFSHFEEWVKYVNNISEKEAMDAQISHLLAIDYSIHYHVWTKNTLDDFLLTLINQLHFPMEVEFSMFKREHGESIFILRKLEN
jgi:predicted SAM-dependent methyltransferase